MSIKLGQSLPKVSIKSKGEATLREGKIVYQTWCSSSLTGKVRVIMHIAGKTHAKAMNEPFIEALKSAKFSKTHYQTTTIINLKNAILGTGAIVTGKAEAGKKAYPWSSVVLDSSGEARKAWGLKKDSSAIILVDQRGEVLFFKDGKLSTDEIEDLITDIDATLGEAETIPA